MNASILSQYRDLEIQVSSNHSEYQYLYLIDKILTDGTMEEGRNGSTKSIFGNSMRFSLKDGVIPLLTTKRVAWKTCFKELMWFIRGRTDNAELQNDGVHIWDGNTTREFLDSRGLDHYREGLIGPGYGFQWRHFNAEYDPTTGDIKKNTWNGIDQLQQIIDALKDPAKQTSRRLIMTAWNPVQLDSMALPPCHILSQFNVREGKYLSCSLYQRSGDTGLGVPFNIASYSFLTHILAKHCDLIADEFVYYLGNAHIYDDHIEPLRIQLEREPYPFPKIVIDKKHDNINDYTLEDIVFLEEYKSHPPIKMEMRA
jgi:thymidylate synthase